MTMVSLVKELKEYPNLPVRINKMKNKNIAQHRPTPSGLATRISSSSVIERYSVFIVKFEHNNQVNPLFRW